MKNKELIYIILGAVAVIGLLICIKGGDNNEKYGLYTEYSDACRWDGARWCTLSNGMEGNCIANGLCTPAFSKDHVQASLRGYRPERIGAAFENLGRHANL